MNVCFKNSSDLFRNRRRELGISQREIANALGYASPQFVSNVERSLARYPRAEYMHLARLHKLPVEKIIEADLADERMQIMVQLRKKRR